MPSIYLILFSLYWSQGLPVGFMTHALPVILRAEGVSLAHIGGFGLLMLPWSIKVFWAPFIDRYGDYKAWILSMQFCSIMILIALSFFPIQALDQPIYLGGFFVLFMSLNLCGATQDIASDALAVQILKRQQQHWGNTLQVIGSRLGFIVGGGAVLWTIEAWQWQNTFLLLAGLVLLNTFPILWAVLPIKSHQPVAQPTQTILMQLRVYFQYFKNSKELKAWLWVLVSFKIADGLSGPLLKPLMVDLGLSLSQIGIYITMLGAVAALFGAAFAGLCLKFWSRQSTLIVCSGFKVLSLMAYAWLAWQYEKSNVVSPWLIYLINAVEDTISSMLLVVMLSLIMQYSRKISAGTDFTLQVSIMATVSGGLYSVSGLLADYIGYAGYLSLICVIALGCIGPILRWVKLS